MPIKVLIVDDHSLVRQGLLSLLGLDPEVEVIGAVADGLEALRIAEELRPDVVLMDLQLPGIDGFEATRQLRQRLPEINVLILTAVLELETISRALQAGANGYFLKSAETADISRAIKAVAPGQILLSPQVAAILAQVPPEPQPVPVQGIRQKPLNELLTQRETQVLQLLAEGLTNKEIALKLGLSEKTIKIHVSIVMAKLSSQSRTQAALEATRLGLVSNL